MSRRPLPAEQPLDETSAAYRALFERNPLPMWLYDSETLAFLEVNDAAVAQYGYSRAEFLGMTILDIRPEEDRAALARETPSLGGVELQVWPAPWRHLRKDGSTCLVRVASHPLRFSGRPARLVVVQDVTETTQTADALRESREQYRFFIGRTAEGVWRAAVDPPNAGGRAGERAGGPDPVTPGWSRSTTRWSGCMGSRRRKGSWGPCWPRPSTSPTRAASTSSRRSSGAAIAPSSWRATSSIETDPRAGS